MCTCTNVISRDTINYKTININKSVLLVQSVHVYVHCICMKPGKLDFMYMYHINSCTCFWCSVHTVYMFIIQFFFQRNRVEKCKLQLVGVTAMLIASKYEEMYAPEVRDFEYITDKAYSSAEIRAMEILMLKDMEYSFGNPLCLHFLRRNSRAGDVS